MNNKVKVYFSASSSHTQDFDLYQKIARSINEAGGKILQNWLDDKKKSTPNEIFEEATDAIQQADVLIAEISTPSIGVGQQISYAIENKINVIALVNKGAKKPSRFTLGDQSKLLSIVEYKIEDLAKLLAAKFERLNIQKFVKFNFISTREINNYLDQVGKDKNLSKSEVLRNIVIEKIKLQSKN